MRAYAALLGARMRMLLQYRAAAWAGVATQVAFGLILISIRAAFYRKGAAPPPMSYEEMVTYSWLGQALFALTPYTANPDPELRQMMRDGHIAYEMARPLDLYWLWFARQIANRVAPTLLRCGPIFLLGLAFLGMKPPPSIASFAAWLLATVGAILLVASLVTLVVVSLLWTISGDGISRMVPILTAALSGHLVPLPYFPAWSQAVVQFLPFRGIVDAPFRLWMGHLPPSALGGVLAHQLVWTLVFVVAGRVLLARGLRRLVVQGG